MTIHYTKNKTALAGPTRRPEKNLGIGATNVVGLERFRQDGVACTKLCHTQPGNRGCIGPIDRLYPQVPHRELRDSLVGSYQFGPGIGLQQFRKFRLRKQHPGGAGSPREAAAELRISYTPT